MPTIGTPATELSKKWLEEKKIEEERKVFTQVIMSLEKGKSLLKHVQHTKMYTYQQNLCF